MRHRMHTKDYLGNRCPTFWGATAVTAAASGSGGWTLSKRRLTMGQSPTVMGTTRDYCRYTEALLTPYEGAFTIGGIDLSFTMMLSNRPWDDYGGGVWLSATFVALWFCIECGKRVRCGSPP